ncbi:MAG: beta-propeller fold lactonase family protein [Gemmataceae bacterium]
MSTAAIVQADTFLYVDGFEKAIRIYKMDAADGSLTKVDEVAFSGAPGSLVVDSAKKGCSRPFAPTCPSPASRSIARRESSSKRQYGFARHERERGLRQSRSKRKVSAVRLPWQDRRASAWRCDDRRTGRANDQNRDDGPCDRVRSVRQILRLVPHVAPNAVYQYRWDAETGKLTEAGKAEGGSPKAGPRHLAFHPKLKMAFTSNEVENSITAYRFDADKD